MSAGNFGSGVLLWIDDNFRDEVVDQALERGNLWERVFGVEPLRLYQLMDVALEVARSHQEAAELIEHWSGPESAGTYVFAIVDLTLPLELGMEAKIKYGIDVAVRLRRANIPFVFLSQNTQATGSLEQAQLATVPYYVKEEDRWRLPEALANVVLQELCSNISWLSLEEIVDAMHLSSDLVRQTQVELSRGEFSNLHYYPYFGVFREFVDRWQLQSHLDLPRISSIRSSRDDSDEHVQQSLSLIFHERFVRQPGDVRFSFHRLGEEVLGGGARGDQVINVVRVDPRGGPVVGPLREALNQSHQTVSTTVLVLPIDESADAGLEVLREFHVPSLGEIPSVGERDDRGREELATRACAVVLQRWASRGERRVRVGLGWLTFPQLLVHPINWMALVESRSVARELSDPYEVVTAVNDALLGLESQGGLDPLGSALESDGPLPYGMLLRVGADVLEEHPAHRREWTTRALDHWLLSSWRFPHGLGRRFSRAQAGEWLESLSDRRGHAADQDRGGDVGLMGRRLEEWEDSAYDVLVGLCQRYREEAEGEREELDRVVRFVDRLGGWSFRDNMDNVDWETLEAMRWPHHVYPMPRAVSRRLRDANRSLWIRPEGLDLAAVLPTGRLRYRGLGEIAATYCDVLSWAEQVGPHLPAGWSHHVSYLADAVRRHAVGDLWSDARGRADLWDCLLGLLRNAVPIKYVADQILAGRSLAKASKYLASVQGYGKVLVPLHESRPKRLAALRRRGAGSGFAIPLDDLSSALRVSLGMLDGGAGQLSERWQELSEALLELARRLVDLGDPGEGERDRLLQVLATLESDPELELSRWGSWNREKFDTEADLGPCVGPTLKSMYQAKGNHLWSLLDVLGHVSHATQNYRYCDGYQLLSALFELRLKSKDSIPQVPLETIMAIMDLFLAGVRGIVAHLALCLRYAGSEKRAARLEQATGLCLELPQGVAAPTPEAVAAVLRVEDRGDDYAAYVLGIPGKDSVARHSYHGLGEVVHL